MTSKDINFAVISDIHLGHKSNPTKRIIENLDKYLSNSKTLANLDVLFLAGDVFDTLLHVANEDVTYIKLWIARLLRRCHHLKIKLRVLEGTPSHDRAQSILFDTLNQINSKSGNNLCDLKYVRVLDIEYFEQYDMHVLYVPDEWGNSTHDCLDQVKQLLSDKGLTSVDMAIMHGMFSYQMGGGLHHLPYHDEESYLGIVKGPIFIGHVHRHSTYERIVAQGSFDRLAHNEEEPKGYVRATLFKDNTYTATFIENKDALVYKTITIINEDVAKSLEYIKDVIKNIPYESHVRIEANKGNPILSSMNTLKDYFPNYIWTHVARDKDKKEKEVLVDHKNKYVPVVLDRQTIKPLLMARLARLSLNEVIIEKADLELDEVLRL